MLEAPVDLNDLVISKSVECVQAVECGKLRQLLEWVVECIKEQRRASESLGAAVESAMDTKIQTAAETTERLIEGIEERAASVTDGLSRRMVELEERLAREKTDGGADRSAILRRVDDVEDKLRGVTEALSRLGDVSEEASDGQQQSDDECSEKEEEVEALAESTEGDRNEAFGLGMQDQKLDELIDGQDGLRRRLEEVEGWMESLSTMMHETGVQKDITDTKKREKAATSPVVSSLERESAAAGAPTDSGESKYSGFKTDQPISVIFSIESDQKQKGRGDQRILALSVKETGSNFPKSAHESQIDKELESLQNKIEQLEVQLRVVNHNVDLKVDADYFASWRKEWESKHQLQQSPLTSQPSPENNDGRKEDTEEDKNAERPDRRVTFSFATRSPIDSPKSLKSADGTFESIPGLINAIKDLKTRIDQLSLTKADRGELAHLSSKTPLTPTVSFKPAERSGKATDSDPSRVMSTQSVLTDHPGDLRSESNKDISSINSDLHHVTVEDLTALSSSSIADSTIAQPIESRAVLDPGGQSGNPQLSIQQSIEALAKRLTKLETSVRKMKAKKIPKQNRPGRDPFGDHAMLSGKQAVMGYKCMACDRPLDKLRPIHGPFLPTNALPPRPKTSPDLLNHRHPPYNFPDHHSPAPGLVGPLLAKGGWKPQGNYHKKLKTRSNQRPDETP